MTRWLWLLWIAAVATFFGWRIVGTQYGVTAGQIYQYVMQGVLGTLLALNALQDRNPKELWLIVFCAVEYILISVCGVSWYVFTDFTGKPALGSLCERDHGWVWLVIVLCAAILLGLRRWSKSTLSSLQ